MAFQSSTASIHGASITQRPCPLRQPGVIPLFRFLIRSLLIVFLFAGCGLGRAQDPTTRITDTKKAATPMPPFSKGTFSPLTNEVFVWLGGENSVIEQENGWLEEGLLQSLGSSGFQAIVRHMGWEGDTVYRQNRMMNWGSWEENLSAVRATTLFVWFGGMEALDGRSTSEFISSYSSLLDELGKKTKRVVIVTPIPFEKPASNLLPDHTSENSLLREYVAEIKKLAGRRSLAVVDLFTPLAGRSSRSAPLTRDGIHITANGLKEIAPIFIKGLGLTSKSRADQGLREAIIQKNKIWFDVWRPMNWAFAYGDRTTQPFAQPSDGHPPFVEELKRNLPLLAHGDMTVQALLTKSPAPPALAVEPPRANPPANSPAVEKSHFKLRDGFSIDLFADEKLGVVRPVQIRWDERGRLWVICAPSYPQLQPGEKANDYILVLEDTDGDGVADKVTKFAEGLKMPMGLEFGPDGVFVCESTKLVYLKDTDGDGKADQKTILFSGFGTGDSHQDINSIRWGADGHLWFTQGYHIWSYVETPHGIVELNRSGIWRLNPRTLKLESFLNENGAGLNCWGVAFDGFGQVFHSSGADFSIWHTSPALINTLHPRGLGSGFAISKGKCTEPEFLGSSALPDDLQGVLLKSIFFTSEVGLYRLKDNGAGYVSEDLGDLISSSDPEFRPLETRVGPDGAIYICDWLNPIIGHYQASYRDPRRDKSHGRIWRMTANGKTPLLRPRLDNMSIPQLATELKSPEKWNRDNAKYLLYRKSSAQVMPEIKERIAGADEALLYELSGVLLAHEQVSVPLVEKLLASPDFHWRAWGAHLVGLWNSELKNSLSYLDKIVKDPHPRVRMEAVVAASRIPRSEAMRIATEVLELPGDPEIDHALTQCIYALAPVWKPALATGKLDFGDRFNALARVVSTAGDTNINSLLKGILQKGKVSGLSRENLVATIIENTVEPDDRLAFYQQAPDSRLVLEALIRSAEAKRNLKSPALLETLFKNPSPTHHVAGAKIALLWGLSDTAPLSAMISDSHSSDDEKEFGALALAKIKGNPAWDEILPLVANTNPRIRRTALIALAGLNAGMTADLSATLLAKATTIPEAGVAISPLLTISNGPPLLSKAIARAAMPSGPAHLGLQWLNQNGRDDAALVKTLRQAAGIETAHLDYSPELVNQLVTEAKKSGDAKKGYEIIRRGDLSCLGCHRIGTEGGTTEGPALAPELTAIGRAATPETIVESVLWPKRQVKEGFLLTQIKLKDGTLWQGYKESESQTEFKMRGVDGSQKTLLKSEIKERSDAGTLMPDGLVDGLSVSERNDLLKFLMELGK